MTDKAHPPLPKPAVFAMDWPLPCDVKVGHVTIGKGVALRTLVARMDALYRLTQARGIADLLEALEAVTEQESALREGGPYPDDAPDLSDALEECVNIAVAALKRARGEE